jgi:hypothetical protein
MIDPKTFITSSPNKSRSLKDIEGTFTCPEPGCFEITSEGKYDSENKKVYWTCSNGHESGARLAYE